MSEITVINPLNRPLVGSIAVPGDKSISHRSVLFSAMAEGTSRISGVLDSDDVRSSIRVVQQLGAQVNLEKMPDGSLSGGITGWGAAGPKQPDEPVDCGNSGTTARLIMGILAPWDIQVEITGDASLRSRPMQRVATPLARMGARFLPEGTYTLPMTVCGTSKLKAITYETPVASAQVKTAVLLAGLSAEGETRVVEPAPSRNHTELMLPEYGAETIAATRLAGVTGPVTLKAAEITVPGDPSSAAFLLCAAAIIPGSAVQIEGVSLNPARIGFLRTLEHMGVDASRRSVTEGGKEIVGLLNAEYCPHLRGCEVPTEKIASLVDEVPILALVAAHAHGITVFRGIDELRVKETDRVAAVIEGLGVLGVDAWTEGSDLYVEGNPGLKVPKGARFNAHNDHRLAMTWAVAGLAGNEPVQIEGYDSIAISYPTFMQDIDRLAR
ncbi:3-phosphoshikimate 1-carboxyvinyltransferase [Slackia heliotrinireducens]|uniref:3-phosphoshikimate 1-carboxyvinyltransferase n=1 Tax=Slackia heliotrinireducens (strain ATCC 29202 / DSM 20476 / NCTC 11029 / RHS 1) TaxID=471855 RepID=C7N518_SLAHD|nr:3-phosphoshikimate 1-carboxyvinyltransferase [Slackia heliotrinireducens]ACV22003.1 3-phosphoshikimate 1-carboxyvinyltransferase [Slackia heliotrinireducens DSM 20476]VEG99906.1 3-phosphoshikimate 1-carboxyvinyltransferase [Slackia heliotrinireducens]